MRAAFVVSTPKSGALRALNYSPVIEALRGRALFGGSQKLGSLLQSMGPSYGAVFTRLDCDRSLGIELLSQSDMFAAEPYGRSIRSDSLPTPENHRIRSGQVLMAGAGTLGETELYGRSIIADHRLVNKFVGPDAMVLTFNEPESDISLYTYAFLCTKLGIACVRSTSYGTKVLRFRPDLLRDLPIPSATSSVVKRVASCIRKCISLREDYARELRSAREPIEQLAEVREAIGMCNSRTARCIAWDGELVTLSAWNYASMGQALSSLQKKWPSRLRDALTGSIEYGGRYSRIPCEAPFGVDFLTQRDVFLIRRVPRRIVLPPGSGSELFVSDNEILLAACGQLEEGNLFGRAELAAFGAGNSVVSGDTIRLTARTENAEVLYSFLSSRIGTLLLRSTAVGTSIPRMHGSLLARLPIPTVNSDTINKIQRHVRAAVSAKRVANSSEAEAVRILDEEVLPEWLA